MTYTVLAACPRTRRIGVGIATYSLAVGGYCPWVDGRLGVISTQANVNPKLGPLALRLLAFGYEPAKVLTDLATDDRDFSYRQVALVSPGGAAAAHTGPDTRDWKGHRIGEMDLRVDVHDAAVDELRRIHTIYKPYVPYYALRHRDPRNTPPQDQWSKEHAVGPG